eukprot:gene31868-7075_t
MRAVVSITVRPGSLWLWGLFSCGCKAANLLFDSMDACAMRAVPVNGFESRLMALEQQLLSSSDYQHQQSRQAVASGSGVGAAHDMMSRLMRLECSASEPPPVVRQEELEVVVRQMGGLQDVLGKLSDYVSNLKSRECKNGTSLDVLGKLSDEISNLKSREHKNGTSLDSPTKRVGSSGGADVSALSWQVETLATSLVQLASDVKTMASRMDAMQSQWLQEPPATKYTTGHQLGQLASDVKAMASRMDAIQSQVSSLSAETKMLEAKSAASGGDALAALERKLTDRQGRFQGALMQVARQVDTLDSKLKDSLLQANLSSTPLSTNTRSSMA